MQFIIIKMLVCFFFLSLNVNFCYSNIFSGQTQGISAPSSFTSPIGSANGSAMGSGFSTEAPSMVAEDYLTNNDISGMFTWDPQYNQQQAQGKNINLDDFVF